MKNVILTSTIISGYSVLNCFAEELINGFKKLNYETYDWENYARGKGDMERAAFHFSFNGGIFENEKLCEIMENNNLPVFSFFVDKPESLTDRMVKSTTNSLLSFVDQTHVNIFCRNFHMNIQPCFIAHGGTQSPEYTSAIQFENRDIDILFCGSYRDENEIMDAYMAYYGADDKEIVDFLIDSAWKDYHQIFEETLDKLIISNHFKRRTEAYTNFFIRYSNIYDYYRFKYRNATLKLLLEEGFPITCAGSNWENSEFMKYKNFNYIGKKEYKEILDLMLKSKITLNLVPTYKRGSHERIFSAMLNGSVCLSTMTNRFPEDLVEKETILFYDLNKPEDLIAKINLIVDNPPIFYHITAKARKTALQKHTWDNRAKSIIDNLKYRDMI